jgi:AcrR family transcriptional regulator
VLAVIPLEAADMRVLEHYRGPRGGPKNEARVGEPARGPVMSTGGGDGQTNLSTPSCFNVTVGDMKEAIPRPYRQTARAAAAEQTRRAILEAAIECFRSSESGDGSLEEIAARAGVTKKTVLRRFGSKEGLIDACFEARVSGIEDRRDRAPVGEPLAALAVLLEHYEVDGPDVLRLLASAERSSAAARIVAHGRRVHRTWCARVFAPFLPARRAAGYEARLDALIAATDIELWKLLRLDLGRSAAHTRAVMTAILEGLTTQHTSNRSKPR